MENQKNNNQLQIELKDEVAQGTYANLAIIITQVPSLLSISSEYCPVSRRQVYNRVSF